MSAVECMPLQEAQHRHARCLEHLGVQQPEAQGMLITAPISLYYLTGTLGTGVLWIPREGEPVLCLRKGLERARVESPLSRIERFRSYKDIEALCGGFPAVVAVDMEGFTWAQAELLRSRLSMVQKFVPADAALARTRMIKTPWELAKMRLAGSLHDLCVRKLLPQRIHPGMNEREIGHIIWQLFFEHGHTGVMRLVGAGETFLGHISAGESGLYSTGFDGPLGTRGMHPSTPWMGDATVVWKDLLSLDVGFVLEGYNTDKTQTFWAGAVPDGVHRAFDCCLEVRRRAAEAMKPGVSFSSLWQNARAVAEAAGYVDTFMGVGPERVNFLGHSIGLQVNEFPAMARGFDLPLEVGMTLAIEPKIALPGIGMVGVEDTFEITHTGAVSLTGDAELIVL